MTSSHGSKDITVVIAAHHEGRLAHHTMRSLHRSRRYATERGLSVEVVVVLDRPDEATVKYFSSPEGEDITLARADVGDLGLTRNAGIARATGEYIAVLDADNLICLNWLYDAYQYLLARGGKVVAHPEYQMYFEGKHLLFRQISSTDRSFRYANIIEYNYWDAVCMAKREIFLNHTYESTTGGEGFGYEDWHWNCQTLAGAIGHDVVPGTVHFLRIKRSGSLLAYTKESNRIIRPSRLFDPDIYSRLLQEDGKGRNEAGS